MTANVPALALFLSALLPSACFGQILLYSFTGGSTAPTTASPSLTVGLFSGSIGSPTTGSSSPTFSSGSGGGYFTASSWTSPAPGTNYFEFTVTPAAGYTISLTSLSFGYRTTSTGPSAIAFRSSSDSFSSDLVTSSLSRDSSWHASGSLTLTNVSFSSATTFRIYGSGASGGGGTFRIDDVALHGSASAIPEPSTYAAIAGAVSLAGAMLRRRRKQPKAASPP